MKTMSYHTTLTSINFLAITALAAIVLLAGVSTQAINAQNAVAKYPKGLENLCKDNPFRTHDIPAIVIPSNASGKNGGITAYGNANSENGKNGPISIGGGYNDKSSSLASSSADLGSKGGNGGIAFCGSANGQNVTGGG